MGEWESGRVGEFSVSCLITYYLNLEWVEWEEWGDEWIIKNIINKYIKNDNINQKI